MKNPKRISNTEIFKPFMEGERFTYSIGNEGHIIKASKKHYVESVASPYMTKAGVKIKIINREYSPKRLVAKLFIEDFDDSKIVICKDGDEFNFAVSNLQVFTRAEYGKVKEPHKSICKPVIIDGVTYPSIRAANKSIYCCTKTLYNRIHNIHENSVLKDYDVKLA